MIKNLKKSKYNLWILIILGILVWGFLGPLLSLAYLFIKELFIRDFSVLWNILISKRKSILLLRTITYSMETAIICIVIAFYTGSFLWSTKSYFFRKYKWIFLIMLPVPSYIHALVWWKLFLYVNQVFEKIGIPLLETRGYSISLFVQIMAFLPIALAFVMAGFSINEGKLIEAGRMLTIDKKVFSRILLPLTAPLMLFATGIIYILTFNDYSISSIFSENLYSLEVFVVFSSTNSTGLAILSSIPGVVSIGIVIFIINKFIKKAFVKPDTVIKEKREGLYPGKLVRIIGMIGTGIFSLQILIPLIIIIVNSINLKGILYSLETSKSEIMNSLFIGIIASVLATFFAFFIMYLLRKTKKQNLVLFLSLIAFAIPGSIIAIGIISFWNNFLGSSLYDTILMPVLVSFIRFLPISIIIFHTSFRRVEERFVEAGNIMISNRKKILIGIVLPLHWSAFFISGILVFVLSLGELGGTVLVVPPGINTLTIKIYNFLHYGSSDMVYALCLFVLILCLGLSELVYLLLNKLRGNEND